MQKMQGAFGESALHVAAATATGSTRLAEMLTMLIRLGMDVNSQDSEGDTPLHWAAFAGNVRGIQVLLQKGAKVMENYQGLTPWEVAAAEPAAFLGRRDYERCRQRLDEASLAGPRPRHLGLIQVSQKQPSQVFDILQGDRTLFRSTTCSLS
ncbi:unnamed protein product [Effrenium voratum]|nr:unnamed protein product [Effrenium voratum]